MANLFDRLTIESLTREVLQLRTRRDNFKVWSALWKRSAKRNRELMKMNAELNATLVMRQANPDYLPKASREYAAELADLRQHNATLAAQVQQRDNERKAALDRVAELGRELGLRNNELSTLAYYANSLVTTANESEGIAGWHLNGDIEPWERVEDIEVLANFVQMAVKRYGKECIEVDPDHFGLCGDALPFEQVPAPTNPDAPADASMIGGLEYVKADPMKFIAANIDGCFDMPHMASLLMQAFDFNESTAKRHIEEWQRATK